MSKINNFPQHRELYQIAAPVIKRGSSAGSIASHDDKIVLVLDGQAEANVATKFSCLVKTKFVSVGRAKPADKLWLKRIELRM